MKNMLKRPLALLLAIIMTVSAIPATIFAVDDGDGLSGTAAQVYYDFNLRGTYATLLLSMLCGRVVWGFVMALLTLNASSFTLSVFVAGAFTNAIPGIILQLVAIPAIVIALGKTTKSPAEV